MDWNIKHLVSTDENVSKFVFSKDDAVAEAVLYKYPTYEERTVICCSVMSGCPIGCRFCGTGDYFIRNLTAEEIVFQVQHLLKETNVDPLKIKKLQIMTMSMGEPMLNKNLAEALRTLYSLYPNAALLVSTSGPDIDYKWFFDLSIEIPTIGLQFSVHESTDEARDNLIPFKAKLNLHGIANKGVDWFNLTGRKPYFNYCVHDKNNTSEDVDRLKFIFDASVWNATLSVICERDENIAEANERQFTLANDFSSLMLAEGFNVRVFNPAGQDDISGGCGQLWHTQEWIKINIDKAKPTIGFGKPIVHMPKEI